MSAHIFPATNGQRPEWQFSRQMYVLRPMLSRHGTFLFLKGSRVNECIHIKLQQKHCFYSVLNIKVYFHFAEGGQNGNIHSDERS